ncbi:hypothetical protein AKO1_008049 [Acrasis kona]|uniref:U-box domain-containing protein n=1 Tax=Acrasis kona TaxID=1008807 RepID=A0AAW2YQV7_9EUKA
MDQYSPVHALSPSGTQDQTILADLVKKISNDFKENRFRDVTNHSSEMTNVILSRGFGVPNPSNIFLALIELMEQSSFQQSQVHHQLELICVLHRVAALSLLEKSNRGTRLDETLKSRITNNMITLKRIAGLMDDDILEMDRHVDYADLHFQLDCINQCVFLMQDTALNQDKLLNALSHVMSPGGIAQMVLYETRITPRMWYRPILSCTLLSHAIRSDQDSLMYFMKRTVNSDATSCKVNWRLWYHHVITLGDVICDGRIGSEMCMIALDANSESLTDVYKLTKYRGGDKKQSATVRARAVYELQKIVTRCQHDSIRQHAIQMALDLRINESHKMVQEAIGIVMNHLSHVMEDWKDQIEKGTDKLAQELNSEWEHLQEKNSELTELINQQEDLSRSIALKELETNEMIHRVEIKKSTVEYCKQKQAHDVVDQQLKQVIKQQSYETDHANQRSLVQRRMELEETMENLPKEHLNRAEKMDSIIEEMKQQIREYQGEIDELSEKIVKHKEQQEHMQNVFNCKRDNFENVQKDYRLATLLSVQQLENKTKNIRGSIILPSTSSSEDMLKGTDDEELDDLPEAFICPITCQKMNEPVFVVESGHSYEKAAIEKWLSRNVTDPLTGMKLTNKTLVPNHSLRRMIQEHSKKVEIV